MKTKKVLAMLLAVAIMVSMLPGCGNDSHTSADSNLGSMTAPSSSIAAAGSEAQPAASSEVLHVACDGEPTGLFPNYQSSKTTNRVEGCMFDTLVTWDDTAKQPIPSLATEWNWDDDTHITFTLRDDVVFTNGEKLTANDVLKSFETTTLHTAAAYAAMIDIEKSKVVDDTHITIALKEKYSSFVDCLASTYFAVFSAKAYEEAGGEPDRFQRTSVGSGPYMLQEWKDGESITLVRNENYWGEKPYYQSIVFEIIGDADSRVTALQSGSVQVAFNIPYNQISLLDGNGYTVSPYNENVAAMMLFDTIHFPVLANENVRKAILMAIDKDAIAKARYGGYAETSHSSILSTTSPYYADVDVDRDVEAAKKLIAESGFTSEELTFTLYGVTGESTTYMEILQSELAEIGVTIEIVTVDGASMFGILTGEGIAFGFGENACWDSNAMFSISDARAMEGDLLYPNCYFGENAEDLYSLLDAAKVAATEEERMELYTKIQQFLADNAAMTALSNVMLVDAWAENITGVTYDVRSWPCISGVTATK